ncbi:YopJ family acetyltransferase [Pantoea sp. JK]|uniref:YopJ family acetyltransferase n=1 Tax=Pantoea sp. JK TaxID=2871703 RepID=UPI002237F738|nr:YopJ family acetyltransferase [Pantoea sp. JK]MCW6030441.1 hypothetical protein [Pantoea sp. JK]
MGFFNKISSRDTLDEALAKKSGQSTISNKTVNKIKEKIKGENTLIAKQAAYYSVRDNPEFKSTHQSIVDVFRDAMLNDSLNLIESKLAANEQPDMDINFIDEIYLPEIIEGIKSKRKVVNLYYFGSIDELLSKALKGGIGTRAQAVVLMRRRGDISQHHFAAVDFIKKDNKNFFIFYESAFISGSPDNGSDYGFRELKKQLTTLTAKNHTLRVAYVEVGVQASPADCGIFALSFVSTLSKKPHTSLSMLKMIKEDQLVTQIYQGDSYARAAPWKKCVGLPIEFLKHGHSVTRLMKNLEQEENVNYAIKVGEKALSRTVTRGNLSYSNSIELKRQAFYKKLNRNG